MSQAKINELQKKISKLEKERESAAKKVVQQQEALEKKENDLNKANTDLLSLLLTTHDISIKELPKLLAEINEQKEAKEKSQSFNHSSTDTNNHNN